MKIKLLLILGLVAFAMYPANAELTIEDTVSPEYLLNHGHAPATVDIVNMHRTSANGEVSDLPIDHRYDNKPLVYIWVDKFFRYVDPALDTGTFMREKTIFSPSVNDL